jgi:hypothetical protein
MSKPSYLRSELSDALSVILPTREETLLLRACLFSGDLARLVWEEWKNHATENTDGFITKNSAIKNLRPLVFNALRCHGLELDKEGQTFLRSAYLKEELRSKIFRRICGDVLLLLANEGIPTIVLKGTALAETVYKNPVLRHSHDIEILMKDQDMTRAANVLSTLSFRGVKQKPERGIPHIGLEHESHLPLELHSRLFQIPYHNTSLAEMWSRRLSCRIANVPAHILAPSDNLLHVCGHAFYSRSHQSLRWVSDAWLIIDRYRDLDWDLLLDCARRSRLILPLSVTLGYLAESLNAAVPPSFLNHLFAAASKTNSIEREFALFAARSAPQGSFRTLIRKSRGWYGQTSVIKWMLFPSPSYLRWVEQIERSWLLPIHYIYRPCRYAGYRIRSTLSDAIQCVKFQKRRLLARIASRASRTQTGTRETDK